MKKSMLLFGTVLMSLSMLGCGKDQPKAVQNFEISVPEKDTVDVKLDLNPKYDIPFDNDFPIPFLGELSLHKSNNGSPAKIGVKINFEMLIKKYGELMPTDRLPNGDTFPSEIVQGKLVQIDVPALHYPSEKVTFLEPFVYAGIENDRKYVGIAVSLRLFGLGKRIEGKSASEILFAGDLPVFGSTVFGPGNDPVRNRTSLGGLFFVVDVTNAIATNSMTDKNLNAKSFSKGGMGYFDMKYIDNFFKSISKR